MAADFVLELPPATGEQAPDSLTFIGTATILLRYAGFTILTDPNFLHRGQLAYLGKGLVSRRLTEPALSLPELPPLDLVVLSHLHGDHFDRVARAGLDRDVPIVTTPQAAGRLQRYGFRTVALRTWQDVALRRQSASVRITALPAQHARGPAKPLLPPVMGSMLQFAEGTSPPLRLYLTGDTLLYDDLRQIAMRYPGIDLTVVHLGGTRILGMLVTMDAVQGIGFLNMVPTQVAVPVHYDDYGVFKSPLADFLAEVRRRPPPGRVVTVERGQTLRLPVTQPEMPTR